MPGLYIHIPFCIQKCPYCDFYSTTDLSFKDRFRHALSKEMELNRSMGVSYDTVYLGGGTPSIYDPNEIGKILDTARRIFTIRPDVEITLEINPGTVTVDSLRAYHDMGINRLTIGVQSFREEQLRFLGRIHTVDAAVAAIKGARTAGFENIGIDLICGLPNETTASLKSNLKTALTFEPEHLSCYILTYEPNTPMTRALDAGRFTPLPDEQTGDLFEATVSYLTENRYLHYEISNFAQSGAFISRHNSKYWDFTPYLGLGPSAHSFFPPNRRWNHSDLEQYMTDIEKGKRPEAGKEALSRQQQITESIFLGLRKTDGIRIQNFNRIHCADFNGMFEEALSILKADDMILIDIDAHCCRLTGKGMRYLDSVAKVFIESGKF